MESQPPSVAPPPPSGPAQPGSPGYRSSSAPTTSVAPPPQAPGPAWPIARLALAAGMLIMTIQATTNQDAERKGIVLNGLRCLLIALSMAGVPMVMTRYRSLRMFSWLLLIAAFFQLWTTFRTAPGSFGFISSDLSVSSQHGSAADLSHNRGGDGAGIISTTSYRIS